MRKNDLYFSNEKYNKPNANYLKDITYCLDEDKFSKVYREIGYIDFLKIPAKELVKVLAKTVSDFDKSILKDGYNKLAFYAEDNEWGYTFRNALGIDNEDLLNLIIAYTNAIKGTKKYETFAKILDATCDLRYVDWQDKTKYNWEGDQFLGDQKDVDHNHVSEFDIYIKNPIPLDIIRFMNSEVKMFKLKKENKLNSYEQIYDNIDKFYIKSKQGKKILSLAQGLLEKEETEEMGLNF